MGEGGWQFWVSAAGGWPSPWRFRWQSLRGIGCSWGMVGGLPCSCSCSKARSSSWSPWCCVLRSPWTCLSSSYRRLSQCSCWWPTIVSPSPPPTTKEERYTGLTINTAKKRITGHNGNFNNREQKETTFSAHIWEVKDKGKGSLFFPKLVYFLKPNLQDFIFFVNVNVNVVFYWKQLVFF